MKSLIPISASTKTFSSERMMAALREIPSQFSEWYFVIADRLQFYNDSVEKYRELESVMRDWSTPVTPLYSERRKWLTRLVNREFRSKRVRILSIDDITDRAFFQVLRNILVAYHIDSRVRKYIDQSVELALKARITDNKGLFVQMSRLYIIEEVALNIYVHTKFRIYDEFYLGEQMPVILELYTGNLTWLVSNTQWGRKFQNNVVKFYRWDEKENGGKWQQLLRSHNWTISARKGSSHGVL